MRPRPLVIVGCGWIARKDRRSTAALICTPPATDGKAGRRDLAVVLAAYRSLAERCPVEVVC